MPKEIKLKLEDLNVKSFQTTSLRGGQPYTGRPECIGEGDGEGLDTMPNGDCTTINWSNDCMKTRILYNTECIS